MGAAPLGAPFRCRRSGFIEPSMLCRPVAMGGDSRDTRVSSSGNKAAPASFYCPISMVRSRSTSERVKDLRVGVAPHQAFSAAAAPAPWGSSAKGRRCV